MLKAAEMTKQSTWKLALAGVCALGALYLVASPTADISEVEELDQTGFEDWAVFGAYLRSEQEPAEEGDFPEELRPPTVHRGDNPQPRFSPARASLGGEARVAFNKELTRMRLDIDLDDFSDIADIRDFHIHCGPSFALGPVLVFFRLITGGDLNNFEPMFGSDKVARLILDNTDINYFDFDGELAPFCPFFQQNDVVKNANIVSMYELAKAGHLYFNLHTDDENIIGMIRGQVFDYGRDNPKRVRRHKDAEDIHFGYAGGPQEQ